jgi:hypothetical protein
MLCAYAGYAWVRWGDLVLRPYPDPIAGASLLAKAEGQFAVMLDTHKGFGNGTVLWRGSLLPLGRAAAPKKR